jgi:hypothetical protein
MRNGSWIDQCRLWYTLTNRTHMVSNTISNLNAASLTQRLAILKMEGRKIGVRQMVQMSPFGAVVM